MFQAGISNSTGVRPTPAAGSSSHRYESIDAIKAFALLWICVVHWTERLSGGWYIANPDNSWPPLADRIAQLMPVSGHGIWNIPLSLLLDFGRAGDQGVQLFLTVSGFGLTWALLQSESDSTPAWRGFYRRRLSRIYPEYWVAHFMVLAGALATGRALQSDAGFFFSLLGIRVTPDLLYSVSPPWWYIGLILQLYAVYPLLWGLLQRLGWVRFLLVTLGVSLAIRAIGLWVFADLVPEWNYLDVWARGAVFVTRLPEFVFGMALAAWARSSPECWMERLRSGGMLTFVAIGYVVATALSASLLGNGIAIFLLGACLFVLLLALFESTLVHWPAPMRLVRWLSDHTYSLFLVHYAVIAALIPRGARSTAGWCCGPVSPSSPASRPRWCWSSWRRAREGSQPRSPGSQGRADGDWPEPLWRCGCCWSAASCGSAPTIRRRSTAGASGRRWSRIRRSAGG